MPLHIAWLHMSISFFICVTLGNVFKAKHLFCMLEWGFVKAEISLNLQWQFTGVSRQLAHEENFYSQNHSISEIGRELWRPPSPTPLLKAGSTRTGCSELCSVKSWIPPRIASLQNSWSKCSMIGNIDYYSEIFITILLTGYCETTKANVFGHYF